MAKVIITIEDKENEAGAVSMDYNFDPRLETASSANNFTQLTPAQTLAMNIADTVQRAFTDKGYAEQIEEESETQGEEKACENEEGKGCCGGGCHNS